MNTCRNCKYGHYEAPYGYVCTNSGQIPYFLGGNDKCENFKDKGGNRSEEQRKNITENS